MKLAGVSMASISFGKAPISLVLSMMCAWLAASQISLGGELESDILGMKSTLGPEDAGTLKVLRGRVVAALQNGDAVSDKAILKLLGDSISVEIAQEGDGKNLVGTTTIPFLKELLAAMPVEKGGVLRLELILKKAQLVEFRDEPQDQRELSVAVESAPKESKQGKISVQRLLLLSGHDYLSREEKPKAEARFKEALKENDWIGSSSDMSYMREMEGLYVDALLGLIQSVREDLKKLKAIKYAPAVEERVGPSLRAAIANWSERNSRTRQLQ